MQATIYQSFKNFCDETQQSVGSVVEKLTEFRNDPEFFQRICQVANNILKLLAMRYSSVAGLKRFSFVLLAANMHDFYSFLKMPAQWFFPITANAIDENQVLDSFRSIIRSHVHPSISNIAVDELAKKCLVAQLNDMQKTGAYRSVEQFKEVLKKRISTQKIEFSHDDKRRIQPFKKIDLTNLAVPLRMIPFLETINTCIWSFVDFGCIAMYFKDWNLLDTAKLAENVGQYQVFKWVKHQHLTQWVFGAMTAAYSLKLIEATRKLLNDNLTPQQNHQARWDILTAVPQVTLWTTIFLKEKGVRISEQYIFSLAIVAYTLDLLKIALKPKHQFFQTPVVSA